LLSGPLTAVSAAQSSVLDQGGAQKIQKQGQKSGGGNASAGAGVLDAPANWNAPGLEKGGELIGVAKAGVQIVGVLAIIAFAPASKILKSAGSHHSEGLRVTVLGILGAIAIAGMAATIVPWMFG